MIVETFGIVRYYVQIYQPAVISLSATSLMEECAQGNGMRINFEAYVQQLFASHGFQVCVTFHLCPVLPATYFCFVYMLFLIYIMVKVQ